MSKTERITITVPPSLKAKMNAHEPPVNWSAVACRAFMAIVGGSGERKAGPDQDMTIIPSSGTSSGVRLLDREDIAELRNNIDAGRIVAVYDDATSMTMAYVLCTNADAVRQVFACADQSFDIKV